MKNKQNLFKTVLNIFKATSVSFVLVVLFLTLATPALAQNLETGIEYGTFTGLGTQDIRISIMQVIRVFLGFVGVIALILVLYGGWVWMSSAGRPERIQQAKAILRNAAIGLMIILLAFSIVSFIINLLQDSLIGGGPPGGGPPTTGCENCGHLGSGIIESVYPPPFSKDNPRNTNIMVTFKVVMDASTIIDSPSLPPSCSVATPCVGNILDNNILIFPSDDPAANLEPDKVSVRSVDGKTYVIDPQDFLGNASTNVWYSVQLDSDIEKDNGETAFPGAGNFFLWSFEIGTFLDLDPVEADSVFPQPDDASDSYSVSDATQATGSITVSIQPDFAQGSSTGEVNTIAGNLATLTGNYNCAEDAKICINVKPDASAVDINPKSITAVDCLDPNKSVGGLASTALISGASTADLGCGLTMILSNPNPGNQWSFDALALRTADTLRVGNTTYTFVNSGAAGNEINIGLDTDATAQNIATALAGNSQAIVTIVSGNTVNIQAALAGTSGNNIIVFGSGDWSSIEFMIGGQDQVLLPTTVGVPDQPRNAIVVINFNEAIDPTLINALNIPVDYFDGTTWQSVSGTYFVSNLFQTVEFIPDSVCIDESGNPIANSCGDPMFCLPVNNPTPYVATEYRVQINAGALTTCSNSADCLDPNFNSCSAVNICEGNFDGINAFYPEVSDTPNGIADASNNTFNGNLNTYIFNFQKFGDAEGPGTQYNLNLPDPALGDDMIWTFYVNKNIDLSPPVIESISPDINSSGVSVTDPISSTFAELIMSKSLKSGTGYQDGLCGGCADSTQCGTDEVCDPSTAKCVNTEGEQLFCAQNSECNLGLTCFNKKYVTLIDLSTRKVGWWITKDGLDTLPPPDGYPDQDRANINHTTFPIVTNYGAEFGSGIQDVYQNCYIPSEGPGFETDPDGGPDICLTTDTEPYCCSGVAIDQATWIASTCFTGF